MDVFALWKMIMGTGVIVGAGAVVFTLIRFSLRSIGRPEHGRELTKLREDLDQLRADVDEKMTDITLMLDDISQRLPLPPGDSSE